MDALVINNLNKVNKKQSVLESLDLVVEENKLVVFLSSDEIKRCSLIRILGLSDYKFTGSIKFFDQDITALDKNTISYMPGNDGLSEHLTVFENMRLMAKIRGFKEKEAIELVNSFGEKYSLKNRFYDKVKTLSLSLKKLVSFVMTIISDSKVMILNDPFKNIDIEMRNKLIGYIEELKGSKTIIMSTELPECAKVLADELYIIKDKLIKADTNLSSDELLNIMLNREVS